MSAVPCLVYRFSVPGLMQLKRLEARGRSACCQKFPHNVIGCRSTDRAQMLLCSVLFRQQEVPFIHIFRKLFVDCRVSGFYTRKATFWLSSMSFKMITLCAGSCISWHRDGCLLSFQLHLWFSLHWPSFCYWLSNTVSDLHHCKIARYVHLTHQGSVTHGRNPMLCATLYLTI